MPSCPHAYSVLLSSCGAILPKSDWAAHKSCANRTSPLIPLAALPFPTRLEMISSAVAAFTSLNTAKRDETRPSTASADAQACMSAFSCTCSDVALWLFSCCRGGAGAGCGLSPRLLRSASRSTEREPRPASAAQVTCAARTRVRCVLSHSALCSAAGGPARRAGLQQPRTSTPTLCCCGSVRRVSASAAKDAALMHHAAVAPARACSSRHVQERPQAPCSAHAADLGDKAPASSRRRAAARVERARQLGC